MQHAPVQHTRCNNGCNMHYPVRTCNMHHTTSGSGIGISKKKGPPPILRARRAAVPLQCWQGRIRAAATEPRRAHGWYGGIIYIIIGWYGGIITSNLSIPAVASFSLMYDAPCCRCSCLNRLFDSWAEIGGNSVVNRRPMLCRRLHRARARCAARCGLLDCLRTAHSHSNGSSKPSLPPRPQHQPLPFLDRISFTSGGVGPGRGGRGLPVRVRC